MSLLAGYAVAAFLPLLYQSIPNPIWLHWYVTHRDAPMPPSLERKAFTVSSMIPVFQLLALGGLLWILLRRASASASAIGWHFENWRAMTLLGIFVGCGWVALMALMVLALTLGDRLRGCLHVVALHRRLGSRHDSARRSIGSGPENNPCWSSIDVP
jgi:hypothetical protein